MVLRPDPTTYRLIPWSAGEGRQARMICDVFRPDGEPFPGDPRQVLRQRARAERRVDGLRLHMPAPSSSSSSSAAASEPRRTARSRPVPLRRGELLRLLARRTSPPSCARTSCRRARALRHRRPRRRTTRCAVGPARDRLPLRRRADRRRQRDERPPDRAQGVAANHGLLRDLHAEADRSADQRLRHARAPELVRPRRDRNAFFDARGPLPASRPPRSASSPASSTHARALPRSSPPLVNSYKRLTPGYEAPVYVSWARINRSVLIRVPERLARPRAVDPRRAALPRSGGANPYLALAVDARRRSRRDRARAALRRAGRGERLPARDRSASPQLGITPPARVARRGARRVGAGTRSILRRLGPARRATTRSSASKTRRVGRLPDPASRTWELRPLPRDRPSRGSRSWPRCPAA